jgi:hypothetical protein
MNLSKTLSKKISFIKITCRSLIAPCSDDDEEESQKTRYEMLIAAANEVKDEMDTIFKNKDFQEKMDAEKGVETEELAANSEKEEFVEMEEHSEDESDLEEDTGPRRKKKTKFQAYLERKKQLKTERKQKDLDKRKAMKRKRPVSKRLASRLINS